jgi:X-X-X-Leu-X-X-Gly heptad repeat protein
MKALTMAMAAMIGLTACNRESKREGDAAAREAAEDSREAARQAEAGAVRSEDAASREARQTGNDVREGAGQLTDKTKEEARQTNRDIREGADKVGSSEGPAGRDVHARDVNDGADKATEGAGQLTDKTKEEARQTNRDIKEGADAASGKVREEARQTNRDLKEAVGMDEGETAADKQLITRIRTALKADKDVAAEARDIRIEAENGEVDLEGTVTSKEIKDGIVRVARKIAGATKVDDEMKVAERVGAGASDR